MKRYAVTSVLNFTDEEWESLKSLNKAAAVDRSKVAVLDKTTILGYGTTTG